MRNLSCGPFRHHGPFSRRLISVGVAFLLSGTSVLPAASLVAASSAAAEPAPTSTVTGSSATFQDTERRLVEGLSDVPDPLPDALQVTIDHITPQIVSSNSTNEVTIEGTLRNVGHLPINGIQLRLQRADAIQYGDQLRHALIEDEVNYETALPFHRVDKTLQPGADTRFTLTASLTGRSRNSLHINTPGAYPLLVNVNGRVNNSSSARLHDARTLLAVHHLPSASSATAHARHTPTADPATHAPRPFTLLWPLADIPREAAYYSFSSSLVLRDDSLPISLGEDGRLRTLLDTARTLFRDSTLRKSVCLAIDPDLLRTVNRMSYGYRVLNDPTDPTGGSTPGKHLNRAAQWLDDLKELTAHNCFIALPWSGASLGAAAAANQPTPLSSLMQDSRRFVTAILNTPVTSKAIWPSTGMVTRADLAAADHDTFILAARALARVVSKGSPV